MAAIIIARPGGMKSPRPPDRGGPPSPKLQPPKPPMEDQPPEGAEGDKVSREECLFVRSDQHCGSCQKYSAEDGSCSKVEGQFDPEDACLRFFVAIGEADTNQEQPESEPDEDDQGAMPPAGGPPKGAMG